MSHRLTQNSYLCNAGLCPKIVGSHTLVHSIVLLCVSTADAQHILVHLGNHKQCPLSSLHNKTLGFHLCVCLSVLCYKRKAPVWTHQASCWKHIHCLVWTHTTYGYTCLRMLHSNTHAHACTHTHKHTPNACIYATTQPHHLSLPLTYITLHIHKCTNAHVHT